MTIHSDFTNNYLRMLLTSKEPLTEKKLEQIIDAIGRLSTPDDFLTFEAILAASPKKIAKTAIYKYDKAHNFRQFRRPFGLFMNFKFELLISSLQKYTAAQRTLMRPKNESVKLKVHKVHKLIYSIINIQNLPFSITTLFETTDDPLHVTILLQELNLRNEQELNSLFSTITNYPRDLSSSIINILCAGCTVYVTNFTMIAEFGINYLLSHGLVFFWRHFQLIKYVYPTGSSPIIVSVIEQNFFKQLAELFLAYYSNDHQVHFESNIDFTYHSTIADFLDRIIIEWIKKYPQQIVDPLLKGFVHKPYWQKKHILTIIQDYSHEGIVTEIHKILLGNDDHLIEDALNVLSNYASNKKIALKNHSSLAEAILKLLTHQDNRIQYKAAGLLYNLEYSQIQPIVTDLLHNGNWKLELHAIHVLIENDIELAGEILLEKLNSPNEEFLCQLYGLLVDYFQKTTSPTILT